MMRDFFFHLHGRFTEADKEKCVPTIHRLVELAAITRRKGLLALEAEMEHEQNVFLKIGISLIVDGTNPAWVTHILQNMIVADAYSGTQLLDRLLITEGVPAIQQGENPRIIALKLSAMLGENYVASMTFAENSMKDYTDFLQTIVNKTALPESAYFESIFLQYDHRTIQRILRETDCQLFVLALYGCGFGLIQKMLDNVSLSVCRSVRENWEFAKTASKEAILYSQDKMLEVIKKLEDTGEIIKINR